MGSLPRPTRKTTPAELYGELMPKLVDGLGIKEALARIPLAVQIDLEGLTPGRWALELVDGALTGREGDAQAPLLTIRCNAEAWRVATRDVFPRVIDRLEADLPTLRKNAASLAPAELDALRREAGRLIIEYADDAGDVSAYDLTIGAGGRPEARFRASDRDLELMLAKDSSLTALFKGRSELSGDVAYALRLARLLDRSG